MFPNKECAAHYLAAMIDGEGTFGLYTTKNSKVKRMKITNTDKALLDACAECCKMLGISYVFPDKSYKSNNIRHKNHWELRVTQRTSMKILFNDVPIKSQVKINKLKEILFSYKDERIKPTKDELYSLYWDNLLPIRELANYFKASDNTIIRWLKYYDIQIRDRKTAIKLSCDRRLRHPSSGVQ